MAWLILFLGIIVAVIFVLSQKGFKDGIFELGKESEITGILYKYPVPMLKVKKEDGSYQQILLLGFGKFGAESAIEQIEEKVGDLEQWEIKLKGNLIYYDRKKLFQIKPDVLNAYQKIRKTSQERKIKHLGAVSLHGEIVDSKCYFGVMKPGEGKIHRSCGIRCISGGIPPVFVVDQAENNSSYFIITGKDKGFIKSSISNKVALYINIKGEVIEIEDWKILQINTSENIALTGKISSVYYNQGKICN